MDYTPLKGRRATLSLIVVIALGATALSLRIDSSFVDRVEIAPNSRELVGPGGSVAPSQVVVVNADGSIRSDQKISTDVVSELDNIPAYIDDSEVTPMDDEASEEVESDWAMHEAAGENAIGNRIE